jgi:MFS family permease
MHHKWTLYWLAVIYCFFAIMQMSALSVLVPELMTTFQIQEAAIGALSAAMLYLYAPLQLGVGYFLDKFGAKFCITIGLLGIGIGSIIFGIAPNIETGFFGRALIGIGASAAFISVVYVPAHYFSTKTTNLLVCLGLGLAFTGPIFSDTVLPFMILAWGWRCSLVILGIIPILCAMFSYLSLRKVKEKHSDHNPFIYFWSICRKKQTWIIIATIAFSYIIVTSFGYLWGVPYFVRTGYSVHLAGLLTTTFFLGIIIASPIVGHLSHAQFSPKNIVLTLSLLGGILFACFLLFPVPLWLLFLLIFCIGICAAGQNVCYVLAYLEHPLHAKGMTLGITNCALMIISALFQPLLGGVIEATHSISNMMWTFPVTLFIAFVFALFLRRDQKIQSE